jgi:methionine synthase II (cobalamin-independent)
MITKETTIEELVGILPESVSYLMDKGIRVLICGEPIWGTLEEVVTSKGYSTNELDNMINDLNLLLTTGQHAKP